MASESWKTARAKFWPTNGFNADFRLSCCSAERDRGFLNFSRARAASEAAFSALAVRSFCLANSVSTRSCTAFASDASFSSPATFPAAMSLRSRCSSSFISASATFPWRTSFSRASIFRRGLLAMTNTIPQNALASASTTVRISAQSAINSSVALDREDIATFALVLDVIALSCRSTIHASLNP